MLIRHTLLYLPAQIIGPVSQFVAIVVFTHWMAPEPYGVLTYVMASQDFVFFLCLSWWSQYTIRYFGNHATEAHATYRQSEFPIMLATAVAQVAASILVILLISTKMSAPLVLSTVLYMVTRCFNLHLGERARAQGAHRRLHDGDVDRSSAGACACFLGSRLREPDADRGTARLWYRADRVFGLADGTAGYRDDPANAGARAAPACSVVRTSADRRRPRGLVQHECDPRPCGSRDRTGSDGPHRSWLEPRPSPDDNDLDVRHGRSLSLGRGELSSRLQGSRVRTDHVERPPHVRHRPARGGSGSICYRVRSLHWSSPRRFARRRSPFCRLHWRRGSFAISAPM